MDIRGKRILVIGGAGLIGSHVVEELLNLDSIMWTEDLRLPLRIWQNYCSKLRAPTKRDKREKS